MTVPSLPSLPPLLQKFLDSSPGDIFSAAAKIHIEAGAEACKGNTLANAVWNADKTALIVSGNDGSQTTLLLEGARLLTKCTCKLWQPARNCPHVVVVWALLKRTVSPEALSKFKINRQMLLDMKRFMEQVPPAVWDAVPDPAKPDSNARAARRQNNEERNRLTLQAAATPFRLLIEVKPDNSVTGRITRGTETVHGWTSIGIPTDLARFMASHYYYESSPRYFEAFLAVTGGKYPIIVCDAEAHETTLVYCSGGSRSAAISFDIRGEEILISRLLGDGRVIPLEAVLQGNLIFDPSAGTISPITDCSAWKFWEALTDELVVQRSTPHTISVARSHFNSACIRATAEMFNSGAEQFIFLLNGVPVCVPLPASPTYLLNIPPELERAEHYLHARIALETLGVYASQSFPCSTSVLKLLNPARRSSIITHGLKAMKRLRAVVASVFAMMDEEGSSATDIFMRSLGNSADFSAPEVKNEALQLLNFIAEEWRNTQTLLIATSDGWIRVEEDLRIQARLMRVLFEVLGLEALCTDASGGLAYGPSSLSSRVVVELTSRLQSQGFSLHLQQEPVHAATWEFSLDATNSGIDWFELKPEIRCNGVLLTSEELNGLFADNGLLRRDGSVMLMDDTARDVFSLLSGAWSGGNKKRSGAYVCVPRLQILDWLQLRRNGVTVTLSPEDESILDSLLNFASIPERSLPASLNAQLRHYQVDAWRWLAFMYDHRFGACLADDMGLGKTVQAITLLAGIMSGDIGSAVSGGIPHLVVAPPSLLFNWEAEIARFLPDASACLYSGGDRSIESLAGHDIIVTSYGIIQRDIEQLEMLRFNVIIYDEAQIVKNIQTATSTAVRRLNGAFTLALTGTPVENNLKEYYAIMDLCLPGLLGTREEFSRNFSQDGTAGTARLISRTRPFLLRRTKQLIASELPPKIEMDIHLELTPKQKALYQRTVEQVRGQIQNAYKSHIAAQARIIALTAILRLRQICLAPELVSAGIGETSPKLDFLVEQLEELRAEGHSALVFSQFTGYLDIIEKGLQDQGISCLRLDGSTPVPRRRTLVQTFQNSNEPTVFLISLKAGGRGLNLTKATYVYHMDPWWNPAVENQASDRAHRIGQTEQVTITRLIMRHTIEEKMMTLKAQKSALYTAILEEGVGGGGAGLTREDFDFLLE
ncbi:MAG TPA: DEAD/DEAH box helicase [Desulfuromonadales bacterium]|nr:DEAD/DEAH box helicase [Desulfuromonadales bacterium]